MSVKSRKKILRTFDNIQKLSFNMEDDIRDDIISNISCTYYNDISSKSIYSISDILSEVECNNIINASKGKFESLEYEFQENERNGDRLLFMDNNFASIIYSRIKEYVINDPKISNSIPCGFGTSGKWKPIGINPCFRLNRYKSPSIGFTPHRDATYIYNEDTRSILSILIYLNDDFEGGNTIFYKAHGKREKNDLVSDELERGFDIRLKFKPKVGSVLIFNHNIIHEGSEIFSGDKYFIRSDIVFHRAKKPSGYNYNWKRSTDFINAAHYYRKAMQYELDGHLEQASIYYQKELAIRQCQKN